MSIVMLNAYNSLGNKFNEFLKFLKIKHNDTEWFLKAMQNSKVIKFIPGFHDQVYRDSLGKSGAYAQQGKNCFKWCCILPGAKITHKGDDHIRTQTQEASVKTTSQISIYWAIS